MEREKEEEWKEKGREGKGTAGLCREGNGN